MLDLSLEVDLSIAANLSLEDLMHLRWDYGEAFASFRAEYKKDFLRYCIYGEKAATIAAEMHVSEQALRMRISRLKKKILMNKDLFACLVFLCLLGLR